ncbi:hypothetical protein [uncultured Desulfovibrio sp.]|uniref:hypothetical protein n=1 Tax=uncultured Desulfovibrio sp. TaxID=167968 RepID=UPI00272CFEA0|nr:hypothetical protein [uncultured Desulfovibrio sp.]
MTEEKFLTTADDFELFRSHCKRFIAEFGLFDWNVEFIHGQLDDVLAECRTQDYGKRCYLVLSKDWDGQEITSARIERTAFHEVLHLLLADIDSIAMRADMSHQSKTMELSRAYHAVIQRLGNARFGI